MIAIILPVHNSGEHLKHAIRSIIQSTNYPYKLIIIESESTDGTDLLVDTWAKQFKQIEAHHTKKEGLITAINYGINRAIELGVEGVYLTQDDVILPKLYNRDWLQNLSEISDMDKCGLVTTIRAGGISGPDYLDGFAWCGTWSLYIPMETIKKVGMFDIKYSPGCGDDIDYTYRVILAGLNIYEANFWVDHHRITEHFIDNEQLKKEHAKYFKQKFKL